MNTKHIYSAIIPLMIWFASCTDERVPEQKDDIPATDGNAWMSLRFRMQNETTTYSELGTADETRVDSALIIFFDAARKVVDFVSLGPAERGLPGQPGGAPGAAFKVSHDAKYLMAVVNPPASYPVTWANGTDYATVNAAVTEPVAGITSSTTGFMMTNTKGDLEPSSSSGALVPLTLYYSVENAQNNPCLIYLDRVAAKVRLKTAGFTAVSATVTDIQWTLNVTNKKYYPLSKRLKTYVDSPVTSDPYALSLGSYREDPNYDNTGNTWGTAAYGDNYNYYTSASTSIPWINPCDASSMPGDPLYCHENTQRAEDNNHAYTTQILIKAKYLPKAYTAKDGTTTNVQGANNDWIWLYGAPYTYTTLMTYISAELTTKYAQTNPAYYSTPYSDAFNAYLSDPVVNIGGVAIPDTPGTNAQTLIDAFNNKKTAIENNPYRAATVGSFTYYAEGISYYKAMLKHDDTDAEDNQSGEFGVVRNSVYDVTIYTFNNPGLPTIPDPDPDIPNDPDKGSWLSIQINIRPWTPYTQIENM